LFINLLKILNESSLKQVIGGLAEELLIFKVALNCFLIKKHQFDVFGVL
jgi:bacteriocin-like protein